MDVLTPLRRAFPATLVALGLATLAVAQPPRGFGPPPGGPGFGPPPPGRGGIGMLLRSPEVRAELELVDDQEEQLRELEEEIRDRMRSEMGGMFRGRRGGEEGERPDMQGMRDRVEQMRGDAEARLAEILTTQQLDRLKQIETQHVVDRGGPQALTDGPLAEKLGITSEQRDQIRDRSAEVMAEMEKKIQAARAEAREKMLEVLTSEQREQLTAMMGAKFELPEPMGPPGFERGRGGRRFGAEGFRGRDGRRPGRPAAEAPADPAEEPEL